MLDMLDFDFEHQMIFHCPVRKTENDKKRTLLELSQFKLQDQPELKWKGTLSECTKLSHYTVLYKTPLII